MVPAVGKSCPTVAGGALNRLLQPVWAAFWTLLLQTSKVAQQFLYQNTLDNFFCYIAPFFSILSQICIMLISMYKKMKILKQNFLGKFTYRKVKLGLGQLAKKLRKIQLTKSEKYLKAENRLRGSSVLPGCRRAKFSQRNPKIKSEKYIDQMREILEYGSWKQVEAVLCQVAAGQSFPAKLSLCRRSSCCHRLEQPSKPPAGAEKYSRQIPRNTHEKVREIQKCQIRGEIPRRRKKHMTKKKKYNWEIPRNVGCFSPLRTVYVRTATTIFAQPSHK